MFPDSLLLEVGARNRVARLVLKVRYGFLRIVPGFAAVLRMAGVYLPFIGALDEPLIVTGEQVAEPRVLDLSMSPQRDGQGRDRLAREHAVAQRRELLRNAELMKMRATGSLISETHVVQALMTSLTVKSRQWCRR